MNTATKMTLAIRERIRAGSMAILAVLAAAAPSRAVDILEVRAESVTVAPGSTNASLNVIVTNNGGSPVNIGGFAFQVTVASNKITFTDITTATTPAYIFAGQSTFGPSIGISTSAQDWSASDIYAVAGSGIALAAGQSLGLGRVVFDVAGDATGTYTVVVEPAPATSLSNFAGSDIPIASIVNGQITVPEPSSIVLASLAAIAVYAARRRVSQ